MKIFMIYYLALVSSVLWAQTGIVSGGGSTGPRKPNQSMIMEHVELQLFCEQYFKEDSEIISPKSQSQYGSDQEWSNKINKIMMNQDILNHTSHWGENIHRPGFEFGKINVREMGMPQNVFLGNRSPGLDVLDINEHIVNESEKYQMAMMESLHPEIATYTQNLQQRINTQDYAGLCNDRVSLDRIMQGQEQENAIQDVSDIISTYRFFLDQHFVDGTPSHDIYDKNMELYGTDNIYSIFLNSMRNTLDLPSLKNIYHYWKTDIGLAINFSFSNQDDNSTRTMDESLNYSSLPSRKLEWDMAQNDIEIAMQTYMSNRGFYYDDHFPNMPLIYRYKNKIYFHPYNDDIQGIWLQYGMIDREDIEEHIRGSREGALMIEVPIHNIRSIIFWDGQKIFLGELGDYLQELSVAPKSISFHHLF